MKASLLMHDARLHGPHRSGTSTEVLYRLLRARLIFFGLSVGVSLLVGVGIILIAWVLQQHNQVTAVIGGAFLGTSLILFGKTPLLLEELSSVLRSEDLRFAFDLIVWAIIVALLGLGLILIVQGRPFWYAIVGFAFAILASVVLWPWRSRYD